jgi:hypothetical protein
LEECRKTEHTIVSYEVWWFDFTKVKCYI